MFVKHQAMYWTKAILKPANDLKDWEVMDVNSKKFICNILGFFAGSDRIVMNNLKERLIPEIRIYEAELFMAFQMAMEAIHTECYGLLIDVLVKDPEERRRLTYAIDQIKSVRDKAKWAQKWTEDKNAPLAERLLAYVIVEGIFFSASFCAIHWLKTRGKMLDGLCKSNDKISQDENLHVVFNTTLYKIVTSGSYDPNIKRLPYERVCEIIHEAVDIETRFVRDSLPWKLSSMNSELMVQYVQCVADIILDDMDYEPMYGTKNPFDFMILQGMSTKGDFFQTEVINYQQANVISGESGTKLSFANDQEY
jgi:ribonucleotide reductase beta subunit family protein with ferritin-like domain